MNARAMAAFYWDLFDLKEAEKLSKIPTSIRPMSHDPGHRAVEDERFRRRGIDRPGIEHLGFKVENVETRKKE